MLKLEIHIFIEKRLFKDAEVFFLKKIVGCNYETLLKLKYPQTRFPSNIKNVVMNKQKNNNSDNNNKENLL